MQKKGSMEKQIDVMEAFYAEVKEREKYYWEFNLPLTDDLFVLSLKWIPELGSLTETKRKELYMRAFFRVGEVSNFMMDRIFDGEMDDEVDISRMNVPARESYPNCSETELLFECFNVAKKKLWICFPEMTEFSGNSLIYMNKWTFDCMNRFMEKINDIITN
jgi:hypothetical protein